jgi:RNA polymerase sigma factor (sigma-70 family)
MVSEPVKNNHTSMPLVENVRKPPMLTKSEKTVLRILKRAREIDEKPPPWIELAAFGILTRLSKREEELKGMLDPKKSNGKKPVIVELEKIAELREQVSPFIILRLDEDEDKYIKELERIKMPHCTVLTRDEEYQICSLYEIFSQRIEELKELMGSGEMNGQESEIRKEMRYLQDIVDRLTKLFSTVNYGLVCNISKKIKNKNPLANDMDEGDLVGYGAIGLLESAIPKFDVKRGFKFSTYGTNWIRQKINRELANNGRTVRLPVHHNNSMSKISRFIREYENTHGRMPTPKEISKGTKVKLEHVKQLLIRNPNARIKEIDPRTAHPESTKIVDNIAQEQMKKLIRECVDILSPREHIVIERRFGLNGKKEETLNEVGKFLGFSRERARQIEVQALAKLRKIAERMGLQDCL